MSPSHVAPAAAAAQRPRSAPDARRVFRLRQAVWLRALGGLILGLVGGLTLAALAAQRYLYTLQTYGPARLWPHTAPFIAAALAALGLALVSAVRALRTAGYQVQIQRAGLIIQRGRRQRRIRWGEIASLRQSAVRYALPQPLWKARAELELTLDDGQRLVIDQRLEDFALLTQAIKAHLYPHLLQRYRQAFNRGEPIPFGPLLLTQQGLLNGKRALKWDEIGQVEVRHGRLIVRPWEKSAGRGFSVPTERVPNFDLCLQWIRQLSMQP